MCKNTTVIFSPAGSGSKGDEGMMRGALRLFPSNNTIIVNPENRSWKADLGDSFQFEEVFFKEETFTCIVDGSTDLVVVGADVVDGSAGIQGSLIRLNAAETALKKGASVFLFFSYRTDIDEEIFNRLSDLVEYSSAYFLLRDEKSFSRFKDSYPTSNSQFFPDLAFYAYDLGKFTKNLDAQNKVIALNFSEQSFRATRVEFTDENRYKYLSGYLKTIFDHFPEYSFLIISNDIRMWENFWSDFDYAVACKSILEKISTNVKVTIANPAATYDEVIKMLSEVDILISGRMHLAIAAFIAGTIPIVVTGRSFQSEVDLKQRGMFDKASGMFDWCFGHPELVVTDMRELHDVLIKITPELVVWKQLILKKNVEVISKLSDFIFSLKVSKKHIIFSEDVNNANLLNVIASLKKDRFKLEVECRDHLKELATRGVWAKHLQFELDKALAERDKNNVSIAKKWPLRFESFISFFKEKK